MSGRLILAIVSILLEEAALAVIVLVGLPGLDINIPVVGLIAIMIAWLAISVLIYRAGSRALKRKPLKGLETMVGTQGKSVSPLDPDGLVSIGGEYWQATAASGKIAAGDKVIVVSQRGNKLIVRSSDQPSAPLNCSPTGRDDIMLTHRLTEDKIWTSSRLLI